MVELSEYLPKILVVYTSLIDGDPTKNLISNLLLKQGAENVSTETNVWTIKTKYYSARV